MSDGFPAKFGHGIIPGQAYFILAYFSPTVSHYVNIRDTKYPI